jgi:hypothetical protein
MLTQYSATVIVVALSVLAFKPLHCAPIDDVDIDHLIAVKDPAIKANEVSVCTNQFPIYNSVIFAEDTSSSE